jgi:hypothetical protein
MIRFIDCAYCKHLRKRISAHTCKAFPDGIPEDISSGKVRHIEPYPNDRGVRFTVLPSRAEAFALHRRGEIAQPYIDEAWELFNVGLLDREEFRRILQKVVDLIGEDYFILHSLLPMGRREWREGILEPLDF